VRISEGWVIGTQMKNTLIDGRSLKLDQWPDFPATSIASGSRGQRGTLLCEDDDYLFGVWSSEPNITK
jgi:hypothetical protein